MHELSLADALVRQVEELLKREGACRALSVTVSIGRLSGVDREAFEFAFPMVAADTPLASTRLVVKEEAARLHCNGCGQESGAQLPLLVCEHCGSTDVEIVSGRDFLLESVEIPDDGTRTHRQG